MIGQVSHLMIVIPQGYAILVNICVADIYLCGILKPGVTS